MEPAVSTSSKLLTTLPPDSYKFDTFQPNEGESDHRIKLSFLKSNAFLADIKNHRHRPATFLQNHWGKVLAVSALAIGITLWITISNNGIPAPPLPSPTAKPGNISGDAVIYAPGLLTMSWDPLALEILDATTSVEAEQGLEALVNQQILELNKSVRSASLSADDQLAHLQFERSRIQFLIDDVHLNENRTEKANSILKTKQKIVTQLDASVEILNAEVEALAQMRIFSDTYQANIKLRDFTGAISTSNFGEFLNHLLKAGLPSTEEIKRLQSLAPSDYMVQRVGEIFAHILNHAGSRRDGNDTVWQGRNIVLSDVVRNVSEQEALYLVAHGTLFIDSDLQLVDIHLIVAASNIEVVGNRSFNSKGHDARGKPDAPPPGNVDFTGGQGFPGFSSGQIQIYVRTLKNGKSLKINSLGGNGGDGGPGGNRNTPDAALSDMCKTSAAVYKSESSKCCDERKRIYITKEMIRDHCYVYSKDLELKGGIGGKGGSAGYGGELFISKVSGEDIATFTTNGVPGIGGKGGSTKVFCKNMHYFVACDKTCMIMPLACEANSTHLADAANGAQGEIISNYFYNSPVLEKKMQIFGMELAASFNGDLLWTDKFMQVFLALETSNKKSGIRVIYNILLQMAEKSFSSGKTSILAEEVYKLFLNHKEALLAAERIEDVLYLEALLYSYLDLGEAVKVKCVTFKIRRRLEHFKEDAALVQEDWKNAFASQDLDEYKSKLEKEIKDTNEYAAVQVHGRVAAVETEMKNEFEALKKDVDDMIAQATEDIKRLQEMQRKLRQNIISRAVFGVLKILGNVLSTITPIPKIVFDMSMSLGETIAINNVDASDIAGNTVTLPDSITDLGNIIADAENKKQANIKLQAEFRISAAKNVTELDKQLGNVLTNSTRAQLTQVLSSKELLASAEWANTNLKPLIDKCYDQLAKKNSSKPIVVTTMKVLKIAQKIATFSEGVIGTVQDVMGNVGMLHQVSQAIEKDEQALEQLENYKQSLDEYIEPYMTDMSNAFENFANDTRGMSERLLIFRKLDLQKMTRQLTSFVRKFTDGFLAKQQEKEMLTLVSDLEAVASAAMAAQTHVNQLEYGLRLSSLLGTLTSTEDCSNSDYCVLRLKTQAAVHTNVLLSQYQPLERAFQQAIFPFASRHRLAPLVSGLDSQVTVGFLSKRVDAMLKELNDRDEMIDADQDKDIRLATFDSQYASSSPFYTWSQQRHADQILRFLRGERVTFVADVRHADRKRNAVKFQRVGIKLVAKDVDLLPILNYLELEMTHSGESHFRCGDRFYAIASDVRLAFAYTFELDSQGNPVSSNAVADKYTHTDVPFSPYTPWTLQLKPGMSPEAESKLLELAQYADRVDLELFGRGTYVTEAAVICQKDLTKDFDLFL